MRAALLALLAASPAAAEAPRVLADTPPVHSLVAMVMGEVGAPALILPPGVSPHDASLTPSEAQALTQADLVVWTGPAMLPWMEETLAALAPEARALALLATDGWEPLPRREGADLHAHGDHDHDGDHDHGGSMDPHAWLDPAVAAAWLPSIAAALGAVDPANIEVYGANAARASEELDDLSEELRDRLAPLGGRGYAAGHDALQYFERAAGLPAAWAVADATGADPAPADAQALREAVVAGTVACLLLDPDTDPAWPATLGEGAELRTAAIDPEGLSLEPGAGLYPALIRGLAQALESCLAE
jgi:zinc transport system substrate-binding protein